MAGVVREPLTGPPYGFCCTPRPDLQDGRADTGEKSKSYATTDIPCRYSE